MDAAARTVLHKIVEARFAVVARRLGWQPAEYGARLGERRGVCEEGHGKDGARGGQGRRRGD